MSARRSPLTAGLLARNPLLVAALLAGNAGARVARAIGPRRDPAARDVPRRVLLCVGGHLGDAIIATAAIRDLVSALPGVSVGVAVGDAGAMALEGHGAIRWLHRVPHWKLDRGKGPLPARVARARTGRRAAVREIAAVGYDAAVDLSAHYPNMATLLHAARIPRRIGWASGGMGALYSECYPWRDGEAHEMERHRSLIGALVGGDRGSWAEAPAYLLAEPREEVAAGTRTRLAALGVRGTFVQAHVGVGDPRKAWPAERWRALAARLAADGECVLVTGQGADDESLASSIAASVPGAVKATGRFSWAELAEVVRMASAVACPDTAVGHLAAAAGTPCVVVFTGMDRASRWRPVGARVTILPRDAREGDVFDALRALVPRHSPMETA